MKILLVSNYQPPHLGGIEIIAAQLRRSWERQGHQVTWITADVPPGAAPATATNIRVPALNFPERRFQINTPIVNPLFYFKALDLARAHDAVNIHSLAPGLTSIVRAAAFRSARPLVITQQVPVIPLQWNLLNRLQQMYILAAARQCGRRRAWLTFVSVSVRDWFLKNAALDPQLVRMTPNAYDKQAFYFSDEPERLRARVELGLPADKFKVLFVGRFIDKKGLPLIEMVARAAPEIDFTLVGQGIIHPEKWNLANVRVVSPRSAEQLRLYFASHDLLLLPSVGEGWPLVICEAMACGTPCLISRETFNNFGQNAEMFLVSDLNAADLLAGLRQARDGQVPLLRSRRQLAAFAEKTWDWDRTAAIFIELFNARA